MDAPSAAVSTADTQSDCVSRRTLQRRARGNGVERFAWTADRDRCLSALWLVASPKVLMALIGCKRAVLYKRAGELKLPDRDPVKRAMKCGVAPRDPLRLPSADELLARASKPTPEFAS